MSRRGSAAANSASALSSTGDLVSAEQSATAVLLTDREAFLAGQRNLLTVREPHGQPFFPDLRRGHQPASGHIGTPSGGIGTSSSGLSTGISSRQPGRS